MSDDQERDATPEEQAEFFISMGIETAIDDLRIALRMNDWSEATHEAEREGATTPKLLLLQDAQL
jgi:hypothetical protein